jgi:hypothetical protein
MRRLAVFTEGYTELLLVERLLNEIAGKNNVLFEKRRIVGGATVKRTVAVLEAAKAQTEEKFYVLLVDCGGDHQVKTRILEEHPNLTKAGYSQIIGIRDVRPTFSHSDVPQLDIDLKKYIKTSLAPVAFILGVMEVEAWFLAEHTHFERIDANLTRPSSRQRWGSTWLTTTFLYVRSLRLTYIRHISLLAFRTRSLLRTP